MIFLKKLLPSLALCIFPVLSIAQPIDLMTAYKRALQHDADIHAAYNQLLSSKEASPQALAGLLPSINASALSNDVRQESESNFSGTGKSTDQFRDEGFAVSLRQPLFNWANYTRYKQANKQVSRAEVEYEIAQQALILRLTCLLYTYPSPRDRTKIVCCFLPEKKKPQTYKRDISSQKKETKTARR